MNRAPALARAASLPAEEESAHADDIFCLSSSGPGVRRKTAASRCISRPGIEGIVTCNPSMVMRFALPLVHNPAHLHTGIHTGTHTDTHTGTRVRTAQHNTAQHSTAQHSAAQRSAAQHGTARHSTAQHSTAQHSTAQYKRNPTIPQSHYPTFTDSHTQACTHNFPLCACATHTRARTHYNERNYLVWGIASDTLPCMPYLVQAVLGIEMGDEFVQLDLRQSVVKQHHFRHLR